MPFRPLLAFTAIPERLQYPVLASPKLDGIRCVILDGLPRSRTLLPIPNRQIVAALRDLPAGLDGELIFGEPPGSFLSTQSFVMSREAPIASFTFNVFDWVKQAPFADRLNAVDDLVYDLGHENLRAVEHQIVSSAEELRALHSAVVARGYEGLMVRSPNGRYKFGRSTEREGLLGKIVSVLTAEAEITGLIPLRENHNPQELDPRGYAKRSSANSGKVTKELLGALICHWNNVEFEIGTGFTSAQRESFWNQDMLGRAVRFSYKSCFPSGKPRAPSFLAILV